MIRLVRKLDERFNMYGHTPCPKCGEPYRYMRHGHGQVVWCDDCGHTEPASRENSNEYSAAKCCHEDEL